MENKKNIAIIVKNLPSAGAEKQAIILAKSLMEEYNIHFIIINGNKCNEKFLNWLKESESISVKQFYGSIFFKFVSLCGFLQKSSINIIFSYLTGANFYALFAGKIAKVEYIYSGIRNAKLPFVKMCVDKLITNLFATQTIINCYSGKKYFAKKGFNEQKMMVIPNCFDNMTCYTPKSSNDKIRIISVGRFVPQKDYYTALLAISQLKRAGYNEILFQIVGFGNLETDIRQWIKEIQIEDLVEIYINPNNIPELLSNADIYLSTSLFEGTSNSIMEALNASLPVVATDVGDNDELVKDGVNGYLSKIGDVKDIMQKLSLLLSDVNLRTTMGLNSNELLHRNFSLPIFKERYINLIEKKQTVK